MTAPAFGWSNGPADPTGAADEVHVWLIALGAPAHEAPFATALSDDESRRAQGMRSDSARHRFVVARSALRALLSRYLAVAPREIPLAVDAFGRPALASRLRGSLDFNLAHTDGWAVVAFGWGRAVGVDVERLDREVDWRSIASRHFSAGEWRRLQDAARDAGARTFLRGWLRKEAYAKARGEGFAYGFPGFSVSLEEPLVADGLLEDRRDPGAVRRWWIRDLDADFPLGVALAGEGECRAIRCWRYVPGNPG